MDHEDPRARRDDLKREYGRLYSKVAAILFEEDPMGINQDDNTDEYEPETDTILPRLKFCQTVHDVRSVVHEEFVRWFSSDLAGRPEHYERIAKRIWAEISALILHEGSWQPLQPTQNAETRMRKLKGHYIAVMLMAHCAAP